MKDKIKNAVKEHRHTCSPDVGVVIGGYWHEDSKLTLVIRCKYRTVRVISLQNRDSLIDSIEHFNPDSVIIDITNAPNKTQIEYKSLVKYSSRGHRIVIESFERCKDMCLLELNDWLDKKGTISKQIQQAYEKNDITYKAFLLTFFVAIDFYSN